MYQFIETICCEKGLFQRIDLHNKRCNQTRNHFFGEQPDLQFELFLSVPTLLKDKTVKCTVTYGVEILSVDYSLYEIRPVESLQLVSDNEVDYSFKYANRAKLNLLFEKRVQSDDILIIKNGLITDTSYANIIFKRNKQWYSPQEPLQ